TFFQGRRAVDRRILLVAALVLVVNLMQVTRYFRQKRDPVLRRFCQRYGITPHEAGSWGSSHFVPSDLLSLDRCRATAPLSLETIRAVSVRGVVVRRKGLACSCNALPATIS